MDFVNSTTSRLLYAPKLNPRFLTPPSQKRSVSTFRNVYKNNSPPLTTVKAATDGGAEAETAVVVIEEPKLRRYQVSDGYPAPLGATACDGGVNFAVYSANAVSATICLITLSDLSEVSSYSTYLYIYLTVLARHPSFVALTNAKSFNSLQLYCVVLSLRSRVPYILVLQF